MKTTRSNLSFNQETQRYSRPKMHQTLRIVKTQANFKSWNYSLAKKMKQKTKKNNKKPVLLKNANFLCWKSLIIIVLSLAVISGLRRHPQSLSIWRVTSMWDSFSALTRDARRASRWINTWIIIWPHIRMIKEKDSFAHIQAAEKSTASSGS